MNTLTVSQINNANHIITNKGEVRIDCPNCDDISKHLYCNLDKKIFHCFKCGYKGRVVEDTNDSIEDFDRTVQLYLDSCNMGFPPPFLKSIAHTIETKLDKFKQIKNLPISTLLLPSPSSQIQITNALLYLYGRGITLEEIVRYKFHADSIYIYYPIYSTDNKLMYYVGRRYTEGGPKYINAPWAKENTVVHLIGDVKNKDYLFIVEGIFDAMAISRAGYNAIALLGKEANSEQIKYITNLYYKYNYIWLDNDAFNNSITLAIKLKETGKKKYYIITGYSQDPASIAQLNIQTLRECIHNEITQFGKRL